jgi:hypothetical protein
MPRNAAIILSFVLGAALHADWHLARPLHHRLSLGWSYHWVITAALFAVVGCFIARSWPAQRWRLGAVVFISAALLAQLVEPVFEALIYERRLGYAVELARWLAFGKSMLAGGIAYAGTLVLCTRRSTGE